MAYGELKVDSITFTDGGTDTTVSVSGLVQNPTFSGDITVTGTISGDVILGGTTISGATVTGTAGEFGTVTGNTAGFTTVTGTTITGTTVNFVSGVFTSQVSGATVTGNAGQFTTLTGTTAGFTTVTGTTVTGTTTSFTSGIFTSLSCNGVYGKTDTNTSIQFPGSDVITFNEGGAEAARIDNTGRLLVGLPSQAGGSKLQVYDNRIKIAYSKTPTSASASGTGGEVCWDTDYIYVCIATDTWKRAALSTW